MGAGKSSLLNRLVYMIKNYKKNEEKAKDFKPDDDIYLTSEFISRQGTNSITVKV
jgi:thymidine kinase